MQRGWAGGGRVDLGAPTGAAFALRIVASTAGWTTTAVGVVPLTASWTAIAVAARSTTLTVVTGRGEQPAVAAERRENPLLSIATTATGVTQSPTGRPGTARLPRFLGEL